jgi:hypothetical protein
MSSSHPQPSPARGDLIKWTAQLGAVTAEALAVRLDVSPASARGRLFAAERAGLLCSHRPLAGPVLFTATAAGLRGCGEAGLEPCRVSPSAARHLVVCAGVAAALERCYPGYDVLGERALRREERHHGGALASARLGSAVDGAPVLHRPDLVLWPNRAEEGLPVAVEVELTVKAPRRLLDICRAWARARCVAGVLYLAPPEVRRALARAIERAAAAERVVALPLGALPGMEGD